MEHTELMSALLVATREDITKVLGTAVYSQDFPTAHALLGVLETLATLVP